ncbi:MAG: hypothetical protein HN793_07555 [Rhodospirillaceae bacterium]|jgi:hypothetical protein|nr:hypothetical protein [Rhodospirillaceae bacterium]MBT5566288.1 hypothetical protein [Rhodospirillaceae bacterium]MBT6088066.1 hypothetical protein [Rhodospirillaceae bacterium]MBT6960842.1 hypothetical protein [Rhodospirillaceae bacterium]MBT7450669.1 hypothetical protein [Rhodospirillaceae bacterium]
MLEYPVDVTKTEDGEYVARLVDLPDGPAGHGIDPYAALNDLSDTAPGELLRLYKSGILPKPSSANDRPTVSFDSSATGDGPEPTMNTRLIGGTGQQWKMLGYSWTNDVVFHDE